jgi:hypothetical protein
MLNLRCIAYIFLIFSVSGLFSTVASAETACKTEDCKITITIKIAFSYNESEIAKTKIDAWVKDIEDVWNGPNGFQLTGNCQCEVRFKVDTMKISDPSQVNCNPGPSGYHCIMVTDYDKNPPRNQTSMVGAEFYRGYMYNPSQGGASENGWWSDIMNDPYPGTGADTHDAAHEAGHMMGLDDKEGDGLMTHTSGEKAKPTQDNIDSAVKNVCGDDACPDSCCCGNGVIDAGKGEGCDPFAEPNGCKESEACCPVCCSCFAPQCTPGQGEYTSSEQCEIGCKGGYGCYLNYKTGCWDCIRYSVVIEDSMYDPEQAKELGETFHESHGQVPGEEAIPPEMLEMVRQMYNQNINSVPQVRDMLANERINFHIEDLGCAGIVNQDGVMLSIESGCLEDPSMNMYSDMGTLNDIMLGELDPVDALKEGRIRYEGVGFFNWIRFAFTNMLFTIASALGMV